MKQTEFGGDLSRQKNDGDAHANADELNEKSQTGNLVGVITTIGIRRVHEMNIINRNDALMTPC